MHLQLDSRIREIKKIISVDEQPNWGFKNFNISQYWNLTKGKNIKIAILDTGVPTHSDLIINKKLSKNFVDYEDELDHSGHSTGVCGIINAQSNHFGTLGIAPDAEIICVKILDQNGGGSEESFQKGLRYCLDIEPNIINISSGSEHFLGDEIERLIYKLQERGIFVICGSGNQPDKKMLYPANSNHTISIGSIQDQLKLSDFSSYGTNIDFVMPGEKLYTTYLNNEFAIVDGTSYATPFFSGILALYLSYVGSYDFYKVLQMLKKCCVDLGDKGYDPQYGLGILNLDCLFFNTTDETVRKEESFFKKWYNKIKLTIGKYF